MVDCIWENICFEKIIIACTKLVPVPNLTLELKIPETWRKEGEPTFLRIRDNQASFINLRMELPLNVYSCNIHSMITLFMISELANCHIAHCSSWHKEAYSSTLPGYLNQSYIT